MHPLPALSCYLNGEYTLLPDVKISIDTGMLETVMPPKDNLVLEGVRFGPMEEMCHNKHIPFELRSILKSEMLQADELLLTSVTKKVLAITTLDGQPVGHGLGKGTPSPIYKALFEGYQQAIAQLQTMPISSVGKHWVHAAPVA
jgi:branched-subunit amino acid aminotransferase/4-amino-4-deoxychorismate lyase